MKGLPPAFRRTNEGTPAERQTRRTNDSGCDIELVEAWEVLNNEGTLILSFCTVYHK
jgi:hypothetical protein